MANNEEPKRPNIFREILPEDQKKFDFLGPRSSLDPMDPKWQLQPFSGYDEDPDLPLEIRPPIYFECLEDRNRKHDFKDSSLQTPNKCESENSREEPREGFPSQISSSKSDWRNSEDSSMARHSSSGISSDEPKTLPDTSRLDKLARTTQSRAKSLSRLSQPGSSNTRRVSSRMSEVIGELTNIANEVDIIETEREQLRESVNRLSEENSRLSERARRADNAFDSLTSDIEYMRQQLLRCEKELRCSGGN